MSSHSDSKSPGQRIDEVLAPFQDDEKRLKSRIKKLREQIGEIETELEQAEQDLHVVRSAKVDALRDAVEKDPMLSELFNGSDTDDASGKDEDSHPEPVEAESASEDRHRLLAQ